MKNPVFWKPNSHPFSQYSFETDFVIKKKKLQFKIVRIVERFPKLGPISSIFAVGEDGNDSNDAKPDKIELRPSW